MTESEFNSFRDAVRELQQQCADFNRVYNAEIKCWIRADAGAQLKPCMALGERAGRIGALSDNADRLLHNYAAIKSACRNIVSSVPGNLDTLLQCDERHTFLRDEYANELEDAVEVLKSTAERWSQ